jgi:soluble lytic murein transglycosylase-like protein
VIPVAQSPVEEGKQPALWLQTAASMQAEIGPPGTMSRHRDRLGIWHIQTAKAPWILEALPLPRPVAGPREVLLAAVNMAVRLPEVNRLPQAEVRKLPQVTELPEVAWAPGPAVQTEPASARNYGGITVVRDSRGCLVITNAPSQAGIGRGPSWVVASAQLEPIIQEAAQVYRLPPTLIRAVIKVESNFVNLAVSPKGAMGLMQLMPGTAADLGVQEPFNPRENIHGGCRYLRLLIDSFGGSLPLALAAYNAGYQRVVDSGYRVPEITETQEFLTQVIGRYLTEEKKARSPWT